MNFWRINTDNDARNDIRTCDLWYQFDMAFTGDFKGNMGKHDKVFRKLLPGDGVFMHHSGLGIVGYGIVNEQWDGDNHEGDDKLLYKNEKDKEVYEYRISIKWITDYDCREDPLPVFGRLPYAGTYSQVDDSKAHKVLGELRTRTLQNRSQVTQHKLSSEKKSRIITTTDDINEDIKKIRTRIGKKVSFKYPGNEGDKKGILKDRVVVESTNEPGAVPYWSVIDLIEFTGEKEPQSIRFGYYRKPKQSLNWGSQTTLTAPISYWKRMLINAAQEKEWFRNLLEEVMSELKK